MSDYNSSVPAGLPVRKSNMGYVWLALLFFGATGGMVYWMLSQKEPEKKAEKKAPVVQDDLKRNKSMASSDIDLDVPEEKPAEPTQAPQKRVRIVSGGWDCSGEIPAADAKSTMGEYKNTIRTCYEQQLKQDNKLEGSVNLGIKVNEAGKVVDVETGGSLKSEPVHRCIRNIAKNIKFSTPQGGKCAIITVPYRFTPAK